MNRVAYLTVFAAIALLAGCRAGSGDHHDDHDPPELEAFHMVDSYGVATYEDSITQLAINPFENDGIFDVFWDVDNEDDYEMRLLINDRPQFSGSIEISEEYCGPGLECDREGTLYCQYDTNYFMFCDQPSEPFPGQNPKDLFGMIDTIPQTMYFILDICDTRSDICEFQILDVVLE